ncbi:hypothetical protein E3N79_03835 [Salmonella enterica]|nr:hypothetical protein [Salmonella enterica]EAP8043293.1 hypothetical protein [Salmonella enterica]ECE6509017.1 hypothetical protein [Salmonella enterica subsp. houtenae]ECI2704095.1 hypothetical protein [Salmonella enterica]
MSVVWTDVTHIRSREEKKNEENRNGTREQSLVSRREYSSLRYHTALFMTVCDDHEQGHVNAFQHEHVPGRRRCLRPYQAPL